MKRELKDTVNIKLQGGETTKLNYILYIPQSVKNLLIVSSLIEKGSTMRDTKYKTTIKKKAPL